MAGKKKKKKECMYLQKIMQVNPERKTQLRMSFDLNFKSHEIRVKIRIQIEYK